MIGKPRSEAIDINRSNPLTLGMDFAMVPGGTYLPPEWISKQLMTPRGNLATGGSGSVATVAINEAGHSFYTTASAGTSDRVDTTLATVYGQEQTSLVITKFDTITGSLFPRMMLIDSGSSSNAMNMFARHTTNVIIVQISVNGVFTNFTTSAAAVVPGAVQALGYTISAIASGAVPTIFVDGLPVASTGTVLGSAFTTSNTLRAFCINDSAATVNMMQGHIFGCFHWNRKLTDTEMLLASRNWTSLIGRH